MKTKIVKDHTCSYKSYTKIQKKYHQSKKYLIFNFKPNKTLNTFIILP